MAFLKRSPISSCNWERNNNFSILHVPTKSLAVNEWAVDRIWTSEAYVFIYCVCGIWQTAAPKLPELKAKMVEYAKQHSSEVGEGLEILPGVLPLLDTLSRRNDVIIGLVHTFWILWPAKKNTICMHSPSLLLHSAHQSFSMILGCAGDRQSGGNRMAQNGSTWYTPILFSSQFWRVSNISWFRETFKQSCSSDSYVGYLVKNCTYWPRAKESCNKSIPLETNKGG